MNRDEAKDILLLYRHHHEADEQDPEIADALALAKTDMELAGWLEMHCARQFVLREKFRQIPIPEGLREQILSEQAAQQRRHTSPTRRERLSMPSLAVASILLLLVTAVFTYWHRHPADNTLAVFQNQMASVALRGYLMDYESTDADKIRAYLAEKSAPADYVLPAGLKLATPSGCAVQRWRNANATMICFQTGKPLAAGAKSDLWLFVADKNSLRDAPDAAPTFTKVNRLITASWTKDGRVYLLSLEGEEADLRKFL